MGQNFIVCSLFGSANKDARYQTKSFADLKYEHFPKNLAEFTQFLSKINNRDELEDVYAMYPDLETNFRELIKRLFWRRAYCFLILFEFIAVDEKELNKFLIEALKYRILCLYWYKKTFEREESIEKLAQMYDTSQIKSSVDHTLIKRNRRINNFFVQWFTDYVKIKFPELFLAEFFATKLLTTTEVAYSNLRLLAGGFWFLIESIPRKDIQKKNKDLFFSVLFKSTNAKDFFNGLETILKNIRLFVPKELVQKFENVKKETTLFRFDNLQQKRYRMQNSVFTDIKAKLLEIHLIPSTYLEKILSQYFTTKGARLYFSKTYMEEFIECNKQQSKMLKLLIFPRANFSPEIQNKHVKNLLTKLGINYYPDILFSENLIAYYIKNKNIVFLRDFLLKIMPQFTANWKDIENPAIRIQILKTSIYCLLIFNDLVQLPNGDQLYNEIIQEMKNLTITPT